MAEWADTSSKALQDWAAAVTQQATLVLRPSDPKKLDAAVVKALKKRSIEVDKPVVAGWLAGLDVPHDPAVHAALLEVLQLPDPGMPVDDIPLGPKYDRALRRSRIIKHYDVVLPLVKDEEPMTPAKEALRLAQLRLEAANPPPKPKPYTPGDEAEISGGNTDFDDSPFIPKRLYQGGKSGLNTRSYQHCSKTRLKEILGDPEQGWAKGTQNAHEFLGAYCELKGLTYARAAKDTGLSSRTIADHIHGSLPESYSVEKIISGIFQKDGVAAARFEQLLIENRWDTLIKDPADDPETQSRDLGNMPTIYWRAAIEKRFGTQKWQDDYSKLPWANKVLDITTAGEYLRAIALATGLPIEGFPIAHRYDLDQLERGSVRFDGGAETAKLVLSFYEKDYPQWFSRERLATFGPQKEHMPFFEQLEDARRTEKIKTIGALPGAGWAAFVTRKPETVTELPAHRS